MLRWLRRHVGFLLRVGFLLATFLCRLVCCGHCFHLQTLCGFFMQFSGCGRGHEPHRACTGVPLALPVPKLLDLRKLPDLGVVTLVFAYISARLFRC